MSSQKRRHWMAGEKLQIAKEGQKVDKIIRLVRTALARPPKSLDGTGPLYLYKPNRGGIDVLGEWGCYDLDFLMGICGWSLTPKLILADIRKLHRTYAEVKPPLSDAEMQIRGKFVFESGVVLDYRRANYFAGTLRNEWSVECEDGMLKLSMIPQKP